MEGSARQTVPRIYAAVGLAGNGLGPVLRDKTVVSGGILWANLHLLFWPSLLPFTTAWIGENHVAPIPTAGLGSVLFMAAIAWLILKRAIIARQGHGSLLEVAVGRDWKGKLSTVLYLAAALLAFVQPWIAIALYALVTLIWLLPDPRIERAMGRETP